MTNQELAQALRDLRDYLVVAGYDPTHAARYTHIARAIEGWPEDIHTVRREARLTEIPGVGKTIALYIKEFLSEGTCSKYRDWELTCPTTVLDIVRIPKIGVRSAQRLFQGFGVTSLERLAEALREDRLTGFTEPQMEALREAVKDCQVTTEP
jgi:DNA polymerase (family X)